MKQNKTETEISLSLGTIAIIILCAVSSFAVLREIVNELHGINMELYRSREEHRLEGIKK